MLLSDVYPQRGWNLVNGISRCRRFGCFGTSSIVVSAHATGRAAKSPRVECRGQLSLRDGTEEIGH